MARKNADVTAFRVLGAKAPGEGTDLGGTQFVVTAPEAVASINGDEVTVVVYFTDNNNADTNKDVVISQTLNTITSGQIGDGEEFKLAGSYLPDPEDSSVQPDFDGEITAVILYSVTP